MGGHNWLPACKLAAGLSCAAFQRRPSAAPAASGHTHTEVGAPLFKKIYARTASSRGLAPHKQIPKVPSTNPSLSDSDRLGGDLIPLGFFGGAASLSKDISGAPRTARSLTEKHQPRTAKEALMNTVRKNLFRKKEMPFARPFMWRSACLPDRWILSRLIHIPCRAVVLSRVTSLWRPNF